MAQASRLLTCDFSGFVIGPGRPLSDQPLADQPLP
jgi:hypothetical protein